MGTGREIIRISLVVFLLFALIWILLILFKQSESSDKVYTETELQNLMLKRERDHIKSENKILIDQADSLKKVISNTPFAKAKIKIKYEIKRDSIRSLPLDEQCLFMSNNLPKEDRN